MMPPAIPPESSATGVLLLSGEGTVLARSGPTGILGPRRPSIGYADLPLYFRAEGGEDLLAMVRDVANADPEGSPAVRVLPERSESPGPLLLVLHHVAAGLVVGVLSTDTAGAPPGPHQATTALRAVWDGLTEGVAVATADPASRLLTITSCNGSFATMFGEAPTDVLGQSLAAFLAPLGGAAFEERVGQLVTTDGGTVADFTMAPRRGVGAPTLLSWELSPLRAQDGRALGVIAVVRDASRAPRGPSAKRSDLDPSSGLPNQAHFLSRLERSAERAEQPRAYTFAVIAVEIRGLRAVERRLGALLANTALDAFVRRIEQRLRPTDLVARTGDRRLAVLLDHFAPWGALDEVVERIRIASEVPYTIAGERMTMSAIGAPGPVWSGGGPPVDAHDVLGRLDAAVARAKVDAPSRPAPKSTGTNGDGGDLAQAVQRAQLELRYLPLMSLQSGRLVGMEALVRWSRPKRGSVPGRMFLPHAEQLGLMEAIGGWVWREVLRHVREWDAALAPGQVAPVHINLSASEFWQPGLAEDLERRAADEGVAPSRIRLEVPEAAVARRTPAAVGVLDALRRAGFEPWLDRFGEGGTRLGELTSLPIRHAKLTSAMAWSTNGSAARPRPTIHSLVSLAHDLDWRLAVGGVERREQADLLRDTACDVAQGFFYHGLLDVAEAAALMRQSTEMEVGATPH